MVGGTPPLIDEAVTRTLGSFGLGATAAWAVAFGGSDYRSVFFTSGSTIYRLQAKVAGLKPMYARP